MTHEYRITKCKSDSILLDFDMIVTNIICTLFIKKSIEKASLRSWTQPNQQLLWNVSKCRTLWMVSSAESHSDSEIFQFDKVYNVKNKNATFIKLEFTVRNRIKACWYFLKCLIFIYWGKISSKQRVCTFKIIKCRLTLKNKFEKKFQVSILLFSQYCYNVMTKQVWYS